MATPANRNGQAPYDWANDNNSGMNSTVPPRPQQPPRAPQQPWGPAGNGQQPGQRTTNKTKVGGGFNLNPSLNISVTDKSTPTGNGAGQTISGQGQGAGTPGADFMSNEDIRAFCEHVRKESRNRATERAMDADHLEAVLRTIPDAYGAMSGSRSRARRVARNLKKIAAAEKQIQKYAAMLYGTFEREFEANLRTVGKARPQQPRQPFGWR